MDVLPLVVVAGGVNQSINQRSFQGHTRAKEKPQPSTTTRGANPASRSDAGLGGCERVATALVCETRSCSTPFIFQWRAMKLMDATSAGVSSSWGEKELPGHVVPAYNIPTIMIVHRWTATTLRRGVVLVCASQRQMAHRNASPGRPFRLPSTPPPPPQPLTFLSPRCIPASPTPTQLRPSSSQSIASPPVPVLPAAAG